MRWTEGDLDRAGTFADLLKQLFGAIAVDLQHRASRLRAGRGQPVGVAI
jgi:hypothetical protein